MLSKLFVTFMISSVLPSAALAGGLGGLWSSIVENDLGRSIAKEVAKSTDKNIDETLSKINKNMPSKVDEMTTLIGLKRSERTIIYEYVFNVNHSKLTIEARKGLRQRVIDLTCGDSDSVNYLRSGKDFLYKYSSLNGDLLLGQKVSMRYCDS
jgi:hypothetical protein